MSNVMNNTKLGMYWYVVQIGVGVRKSRPNKTAKRKAFSTLLLLDIMSLFKSKGIDVDRPCSTHERRACTNFGDL